MKWNPLKKLAAALLVLTLTFSTATPAFAAEEGSTESVDSKSIKLMGIVGEVTIEKGSKTMPTKNAMRLFDGWTVTTGQDSHALLELDDSKFVKTDQYTKIKINKSKKTNTISVISGALFFNVTEPLATDESMYIRTTSLTMGVRGTSGSVSQRPNLESSMQALGQIYSGNVEIENRATGNTEKLLYGKQYIQTDNQKSGYNKDSIVTLKNDLTDILGIAISEIAKTPKLLDEMIENGTVKNVNLLSKNQQSELLKGLVNSIQGNEKKALDKTLEVMEESQKEVDSEIGKYTPSGGGVNNNLPESGVAPDQPLPKETVQAETTPPPTAVGENQGSATVSPPVTSSPTPTLPPPPPTPPPATGLTTFTVDGVDGVFNTLDAAIAARTDTSSVVIMTGGTYTLTTGTSNLNLAISSGATFNIQAGSSTVFDAVSIRVKSGGSLGIAGGTFNNSTIITALDSDMAVTDRIILTGTDLTVNSRISGVEYLNKNTNAGSGTGSRLIFAVTATTTGTYITGDNLYYDGIRIITDYSTLAGRTFSWGTTGVPASWKQSGSYF